MNKIADEIYDETDEQTASIELAKAILSSKNRGTNNPAFITGTDSNITHSQSQGQSKEWVAHNVAIRFKDDKSKLHRQFGECLVE